MDLGIFENTLTVKKGDFMNINTDIQFFGITWDVFRDIMDCIERIRKGENISVRLVDLSVVFAGPTGGPFNHRFSGKIEISGKIETVYDISPTMAVNKAWEQICALIQAERDESE